VADVERAGDHGDQLKASINRILAAARTLSAHYFAVRRPASGGSSSSHAPSRLGAFRQSRVAV
jgi:hypothetical protein